MTAVPPPDKPSDQVLVRRASMGDHDAFTVLFERHSDAVYHYVLRMLDGHEADARDASQEAWISAWKGIGTFHGDAKLRTWLFTVASRAAIDLRQRRRPVPVEDQLLHARADTLLSDDVEHEFAGLQLWEKLTLALSELPWRQKAVWLLREIEDMSYRDIALVLTTTPTIVRGQLHRARQTVALRMEQWR